MDIKENENPGYDDKAVKDPVCGMFVARKSKAHQIEYQGQNYLFCSPGCLRKFESDPERYILGPGEVEKPESKRSAEVSRKLSEDYSGSYTCPMHPEVVQDIAGACPICGMDLEPRVATSDEEGDPELARMGRRFWVSVGLSLPVFFITMSDMIPSQPLQQQISSKLLTWI